MKRVQTGSSLRLSGEERAAGDTERASLRFRSRQPRGERPFVAVFLMLSAVGLLGCGPKKTAAPENQSPQNEAPIDFSFAGIDGSAVDASSTRGRATVLLFVTTFDVASQTQAKRLEDAYRLHAPRINAVAVVLEAPRYVDLARSFRDVLGLSYSIAMADKASLASNPQLKHVGAVPAWIFLDRSGRVSSVASGALHPDRIEALVGEAE
jgi:peroxiredoxin